MALGVCTGPLRGKPLNSWLKVDFPARRVFSPSLHSYFMINDNDGFLYAVGYNDGGKLGAGIRHNSTVNRWIKRPVKTNLQNVVKMVGDDSFVIALTNTGELYGAGMNTDGPLGLGSTNPQEETFTRIDTPNTYMDVAAGSRRVLAVRSDGSLWGWGRNIGAPGVRTRTDIGTYADIAISSSDTPIQLAEIVNPITGAVTYKTDWRQVYCTNDSSIAIDSGGVAYGRGGGNVLCNGDNSFNGNNRDFDLRCGKLEGTYDPGCTAFPCTITIDPFWNRADTTWSQLMCGAYHALGYSGGTLYGWGEDSNGQFGMGNQQVVSWRASFGGTHLVYFVNDRPSETTNLATNPVNGLPNRPWIEDYYKNSRVRFQTTQPTNWTTINGTSQFLGQNPWYEKDGDKSPYAVQITLGPWAATQTLIPTGVIKCSGNTTYFLTGKRLYACGDLQANNTANTSQQNAEEIVLPTGVQGNIDEFDVSRLSHTGILRVGTQVYFFGTFGWRGTITGGLTEPLKYIIRNTTAGFNPIKPVKP